MNKKLLIAGIAIIMMMICLVHAAPQVPTLISYQGKLANQTTAVPFTTASIRINVTNRSNFNEVIWNNTYDDITDSNGVFKLVLGRTETLYLTPGRDYNIIAMVDLNSATYTTPDLIFGDLSPSGDEIIFNAGGPSDATELVMSDNTTSVEQRINELQSSNASNWNVSSGTIYPTVLSNNVGIGTTNAHFPLTVQGNSLFNMSSTSLTLRRGHFFSDYYPTITPIDTGNTYKMFINGSIALSYSLPLLMFRDTDDNNISGIYYNDKSFYFTPWAGSRVDSYYFDVSNQSGSAKTALFINRTDFVINQDSEDMNFRVESNNSEYAFFVQGDTGQVGIGTESPTSKLHVVGDANITGTVYAHNYSGNSDIIFINGSGVETARITESGNLGIGSSTPSEKLSVNGTMQISSVVPRHAGNFSGTLLNNPVSVYVSGKYAYAVGFSSLYVVDISDPSDPVRVGKISNGEGGSQMSSPLSVYISGKYAYIVDNNGNALEIVDVSDPSNPAHTGKLLNGAGGALLANPHSVYVSGKYAYISSGGSPALEIVDVSDPSNPTHAGNLSNGVGGALLNQPSSVYVSGKYAYITDSLSGVLEIVDVSDPSNPAHAGNLSHGVGGALLANPNSVYVSGKYAYVASTNSNALEIVDISDPSEPFHAASIVDGAGGALLDRPYSVYVSGKYAYVVGLNSDALEIIDVSDPTNPFHAASIVDGAGGALLDRPYSVYVSGKYAYVASYNNDALEIVDISGLDAPSASIGTISTSTLQVTENADIKNDLSIGSGLVVGGSTNIQGELSVYNDTSIGGDLTVPGINLSGDYRTSWPTVATGLANSTAWNRTGTDVILANTPDEVGIGTESPTSKLHVIGDTNITENIFLGNNLTINNAGDGGRIKFLNTSGEYDGAGIWKGGFNNLRIDSGDGNLYINSGSNGRFIIQNSSHSEIQEASNKLIFDPATGNLNISGILYSNGLIDYGNLSVLGINLSGDYRTAWPEAGGGNSSAWNRTGTDVILANTGDDVGIGTTNPLFKLQINTGGAADGITLNGSLPTLALSNTSNFIRWQLDDSYLHLAAGNTESLDTYRIYMGPSGDQYSYFEMSYPNKEIVFNQLQRNVSFRVESYSNNNTLFVNGTTGYVGIGTGTPSHELNVVGSANITGNVNVTRALDAGIIYVNGTLAIENNGTHICFGGC